MKTKMACVAAYSLSCWGLEQVQYPDAQQTMMTDLKSIRNWAGFLQKTEIKFDMLSAVDELAKQARTCTPAHTHCAQNFAGAAQKFLYAA